MDWAGTLSALTGHSTYYVLETGPYKFQRQNVLVLGSVPNGSHQVRRHIHSQCFHCIDVFEQFLEPRWVYFFFIRHFSLISGLIILSLLTPSCAKTRPF